jgi:porphobilinogen synthase
MSFPIHRGRRLRRTPALRALASETRLHADQLIAPLFVREGHRLREPIASMPGHARLSPDLALEEAAALAELGVRSVLLFGIPDRKDEEGSGAWDPDGPVPQAIRLIKEAVPSLTVWADVCLCEYTDHGHCGVLDESGVNNDATLPLLGRAAVTYARAGADVIAPSDMMDGRVGEIRAALDEAGFEETVIVSYAVKYASAFYGPFRDAAGSTPQFGDRKAYQMDPPNVREAIREALADVSEGADMVMVKPGLPYLDVIRAVRDRVDVPVVAYQVSGEFSMLHAAADRGWMDLPRAMMETSIALRRAGADLLVTYFAKELAQGIAKLRAETAAAATLETR